MRSAVPVGAAPRQTLRGLAHPCLERLCFEGLGLRWGKSHMAGMWHAVAW